MSSEVDKLAIELLGLPASARAELARKLIASLDEEEDGDVEAFWAEEAERRLSEIREGKVKGEPAERAFGGIRGRLT
ncbi:MAG: addiction module protein [Candidatus Coatesbacteria bacterium]|nr:addiction module protein [Candidatus Coatesbacteria bacterium]